MNVKMIKSVYSFICKKYFFISYALVLSVLITQYITNVEFNHIFYFKFDHLNVIEVSFYLIGNLVLCALYHKIINRFKIISFLWIVPLIPFTFKIVTVWIGYYF